MSSRHLEGGGLCWAHSCLPDTVALFYLLTTLEAEEAKDKPLAAGFNSQAKRSPVRKRGEECKLPALGHCQPVLT